MLALKLFLSISDKNALKVKACGKPYVEYDMEERYDCEGAATKTFG